jgi:murein DD-endopeptidase MepM/ murein hydrolase activator NlpD
MCLLSKFRRYLYILLGLLVSFGVITIVHPAIAQIVQVIPTSPHLGDTIALTLQSDLETGEPPVVKIGQITYPMFANGQNRWRALVPTTPLDRPGPKSLQVWQGGREVKALSVTVRDRKFPIQRIWLPPGKDDLGTDLEFDRVDAFKKLVTPQKYWQGKFIRPNAGPTTSGYGIRRYYNGVFAKDYYHRGVDYAGGYGSPVVAPAAGRVALVGRVAQGFELHGNTVGIDHGQGVASIFIHLSRINVKEGEMVKPGQVIGAIGSTGASTGPHLHWGLYVHGLSVDPVPWREGNFD